MWLGLFGNFLLIWSLRGLLGLLGLRNVGGCWILKMLRWAYYVVRLCSDFLW